MVTLLYNDRRCRVAKSPHTRFPFKMKCFEGEKARAFIGSIYIHTIHVITRVYYIK